MKTTPTIIAAVLLLASASGCKENTHFHYDPAAAALNLWLGSATVVADSVVYNFAYQQPLDSLLFHVRLTGLPADFDRPFALEATGDTDDLYYSTPTLVLRGGEYQTTFPIYFTRPDGYTAFKETDGHVIFTMKENPYFSTGVRGTNRLVVVLRNRVGKPENWDVATAPYRPLATYFGAYSDVKYAFIVQTTGRSNFKVYYTTSPTIELADDEINFLEVNNMANRCKIALLEHNALHGDLLDENNEKVTFP